MDHSQTHFKYFTQKLAAIIWLLGFSITCAQTTYSNLDATDANQKVYFNVYKNTPVAEHEEWHLSFCKTQIAVRGGVIMLEKDFDEVQQVPTGSNYQRAPEGKPTPLTGWYEYDMGSHLISTLTRTYLLDLGKAKPIKFSIVSYYRDAPAYPEPGQDRPGFYTFRFVQM